MAKNPLHVQNKEGIAYVGDRRWQRSKFAATESVNATLKVDEAIKKPGDHLIKGWVKSGTPVYLDPDTKTVQIFDDAAKQAGKKMYGLLHSDYKIVSDYDRTDFYETLPVAVYVVGVIYHQWLPVTIDPADLPSTIQTSIL